VSAVTVSELRQQAKAAGITGYSDMNKTQLVEALATKQADAVKAAVQAAKPGPALSRLTVSYSYDIKANLGQGTYESASVHITKGEQWDVPEGMSLEDASFFWNQRYEALKAEVDPLVEEEYKNLSCFAG